MAFVAPKGQPDKPGTPIKSFLGQTQVDDHNILDLPLGQLIYLKNMEYKYSNSGREVYLETKRGSTLEKDIQSIVYGAGNYVYNAIDQYLVWVNSSGALQYLDTTGAIQTLALTFTPGYQHYFVMYGQGVYSTLYGNDPTTGVYKINGATPASGGYVSNIPIDSFDFSYIGGRFIGAKGHIVYYTEQQISSTNLTNLETWSLSNANPVSPDSGTGFKFVIDNGEITFLYKDTGVWYLPNANEAPADWRFPKTTADTGTASPKTVCLAKYGKKRTGLIWLGTDKTLRFMQPTLDRNAGKLPTLVGGEAKIISAPFQSILDKIPNAYLYKCKGKFFNGLYILNIVSENSTELNYTLVVDTEKLLANEGKEGFPQPFWFFSETMNNSELVVDTNLSLYGFNIEGYISKLFVANTFTEEVPARIDSSGKLAIPWAWYTGWWRFFNKEVELIECVVNFKVRGLWGFTFLLNSFTLGEGPIPDFDSGSTNFISPNLSASALYDVSRYNVDRYSSSGQLSQNVGIGRFGEYFLFGAYNASKNEPATFYGLSPFFKAIKSSPISTYS